jgi:hypothetical protein
MTRFRIVKITLRNLGIKDAVLYDGGSKDAEIG